MMNEEARRELGLWGIVEVKWKGTEGRAWGLEETDNSQSPVT